MKGIKKSGIKDIIKMNLKFRQVHLDFHTSEKIYKIGEHFNKKQFQSALKTGCVDSITLFSKCHHGWAYHPSEANEMHPNLDFDLLKAQIEAAHEIGVKTPVYISAGFDEKLAHKHPEWLARNKDESLVGTKSFAVAGYHKFCMNTPYLDYLRAQVEEVCKNYDIDGIFLDIVGIQPCYCKNCVAEREAAGADPYDEDEAYKHAQKVYSKYAKAMREAVDKYKPGFPIFHNGGHIIQGRRDLAHFNTHLEIESLPTGEWGYDHFPISARYCQGIGMEFLGMTGKFHTAWGEFGGFKHLNALRYEVALSVANGAKCSVGDQLSPTGEMDMTTYELIGTAYSELKQKEPWLDGVESVADIAVFSSEAYCVANGIKTEGFVDKFSSGVSRIMHEGKFLYDIVDYESSLDKYRVVVLPDIVRIDAKLKVKLSEFIKNGGKILATGEAGLKCDKNEFAFDFGAKWEEKNPYIPDYFRPLNSFSDMPDTGYIMYAKGQKISCTGEELGVRENPYFNRERKNFCSHQHSPNSCEYGGSGITEGKDGIYIAWNIFEDYAVKGSLHCKQMVIDALNRMLGDKKTLTTNLPSQGIVTLMKQKDRFVCHLLYASPVKRGDGIEVIEDILPIINTELNIRIEKTFKRVYLAPQNVDIPYKHEGNILKIFVDKFECHQMIVIE